MVTSKNTKIIIAIIVIVLVFVGGFYLKDYLDSQKKINDIRDYKKAFYTGMLCEYSCPLAPQLYKNKTEMLPTIDCVQSCTAPFKAKFSSVSYTQPELESDRLLSDMNSTIVYCKTHSVNMSAMTLDYPLYYNCSSTGLEGLKENYSYLK